RRGGRAARRAQRDGHRARGPQGRHYDLEGKAMSERRTPKPSPLAGEGAERRSREAGEGTLTKHPSPGRSLRSRPPSPARGEGNQPAPNSSPASTSPPPPFPPPLTH